MRSQPYDQRYGAKHPFDEQPILPLKRLMKHRSRRGKPAPLSQIEAHGNAQSNERMSDCSLSATP